MDGSTFLPWHWQHFPAMQALDMVKLVFQACCGCGHLLADEAIVIDRMEQEAAALVPDPEEPLYQPLGRYVRLNLRSAMAAGIPFRWIARMMQLSTDDTSPDAGRREALDALRALDAADMPFPQNELDEAARRLAEDPHWLPNHSESYREAYQPAYRVIARRFVWLLEALAAIGNAMSEHQLLVCIDGPCASGKTTMAEQLAAITDGTLIHMDDFYTPHAQKTPERLARPAGNADIERFLEEFLHPWLAQGEADYRPYLCHADAFGQPVHAARRPVTLIEGSYSLHPEIAAHADVKLWVSIPLAMRHERILRRNGEGMLRRFVEQWIPLEDAYASAFSLPDEGCICLSGMDAQEV